MLAQEAMKESEEKFRLLAETAQAVIGVVQGDKFVYVNPFLEHLSGYTRDELLRIDLARLIHPDYRSIVLDRARRRQAGENVESHYEFVMLTKAQEPRWLDFSVVAIRYLGKPALVGIAFDITDRKKAEDALRLNEERLRLTAEAATVGAWTWDIVNNKNIWTDKCKDIFGVSHQTEPSIELLMTIIHPEDRERVKRILDEAIEQHKEYDAEYRVIHPDNSIHWIHSRGRAYYYADNTKPLHAYGVVTEITGRKQTEEVVRREQAFLREVIDATPSMIFVKDWDGRFVLVNKALASCYGTTIDGIVGKTDADFNPNADEVAHFLRDDREVMSTRLPKSITEEAVTCADGQTRWFATFKVPLTDKDGICNRVLGVATDITDRKRIADALFFIAQRGWKAGGEDFFASLTQYLAQTTGVDYAFIGRLKEGNEIVQTVALYAKGQVQPNIEYQLKHTPCHNVVGQSLRCYTEDIQQLFPLDDLLKELDIESYIGMPLWDSSHKPIGLISVMHSKPLTNPRPVESLLQLVAVRAAGELERRKAEEQLQFQLDLTRKAEETLRESEFRLLAQTKELETVIGIVSHDLRAPLVNVKGFADEINKDCSFIRETLQKKPSCLEALNELGPVFESLPESIHFIISSAEAMDNLAVSLVSVARAGLGAISPEQVDMNEVLKKVLASIQFKLRQKNVSYDIDTDLPPCFGDKAQITQIFSNLLDNAAKYLDPDRPGQICIGCDIQVGHALYWVSDNGIGIAPEDQEKIFEPYYQLHEKAAEGVGMGLATVKRIVDRNNGRIWVDSLKGQGATFYVALPITPPR